MDDLGGGTNPWSASFTAWLQEEVLATPPYATDDVYAPRWQVLGLVGAVAAGLMVLERAARHAQIKREIKLARQTAHRRTAPAATVSPGARRLFGGTFTRARTASGTSSIAATGTGTATAIATAAASRTATATPTRTFSRGFRSNTSAADAAPFDPFASVGERAASAAGGGGGSGGSAPGCGVTPTREARVSRRAARRESGRESRCAAHDAFPTTTVAGGVELPRVEGVVVTEPTLGVHNASLPTTPPIQYAAVPPTYADGVDDAAPRTPPRERPTSPASAQGEFGVLCSMGFAETDVTDALAGSGGRLQPALDVLIERGALRSPDAELPVAGTSPWVSPAGTPLRI